MLKHDVGLLGEIFVIAAELHFDFHIGHIHDFLNELVGHTHILLLFFGFRCFLPAKRFKPVPLGPQDRARPAGILLRVCADARHQRGLLQNFFHVFRGSRFLHRSSAGLQRFPCFFRRQLDIDRPARATHRQHQCSEDQSNHRVRLPTQIFFATISAHAYLPAASLNKGAL
ncbi:hypothetical protein NSPZN2_30713 [Nitrospira defluvii]|uniref:Uncharacterized protein n=1 Tax=Nitrospira defluvii TaxID=330214 RepID=A0ABM8RNF2_9BACT|nr:hypothetical protein NSPZN2_30713 [Nitrospira defluvii]